VRADVFICVRLEVCLRDGVKMKPMCGVYAGTNCELVLTDDYNLLFVHNQSAVYAFLTDAANQKCIHAAKAEVESGDICAEYLVTQQGGTNFVKGAGGHYPMRAYLDNPVACIQPLGNEEIQCCFPLIGDYIVNATLIEDLTGQALRSEGVAATDENIGYCLNRWHVGIGKLTYRHGEGDYFNGVVINTPKHMYHFEAHGNGYIYARAARYICTNKGVGFHQNYRLYFSSENARDNHVVIPKNNIAAAETLQIDEGAFKQKTCTLKDNTFYWPVLSASPTSITLVGCDDALYKWFPHSPFH